LRGRQLRDGLVERNRRHLERQRQRTRRREHLRLAHVEHGTRRVRGAGGGDRREPLQGSDAPVGEGFLAVEARAVHRDFGVVELVCHLESSDRGEKGRGVRIG
jgi:hypothetical protein